MGFFKKLFGGGSAEMAGQSPWQARLQAAKKRSDDFHEFWEYKNVAARELVKQLLSELAPSFGNGKVKELPDDGHIDLRGSYAGAPIRFAVWMSFGSFWGIEMRYPNGLGELELERDHRKIPKHKEEGDPWEEDEERRIFLGKGIFVEGYDDGIEEKLAAWSRLPDQLQTVILTEMERLDMRAIRSSAEDISLNVKPGLNELHDPLAYMTDCAKLLTQLKDAAGAGAAANAPGRASRAAAAQQPHQTLTCAYCSSLFILAPGHNSCPNCGAPAQQ